MCGRYLLEDEAYADILIILNNLNKDKSYGTASPTPDAHVKNEIIKSQNPGSEIAHGEIFPATNVPVILKDGAAIIKWGFPHWKNSGVIINARSETASEKNMFRKPLKERRCVVPSSGFFEWSRSGGSSSGGSGGNLRGGKKKDKFLFQHPGENKLYMAGIVSTFRDALGLEYSAFVILTTEANDSVAPIHDRMPVILEPDELDMWVNDNVFTEFAMHRTGPELSAILAG